MTHNVEALAVTPRQHNLVLAGLGALRGIHAENLARGVQTTLYGEEVTDQEIYQTGQDLLETETLLPDLDDREKAIVRVALGLLIQAHQQDMIDDDAGINTRPSDIRSIAAKLELV